MRIGGQKGLPQDAARCQVVDSKAEKNRSGEKAAEDSQRAVIQHPLRNQGLASGGSLIRKWRFLDPHHAVCCELPVRECGALRHELVPLTIQDAVIRQVSDPEVIRMESTVCALDFRPDRIVRRIERPNV